MKHLEFDPYSATGTFLLALVDELVSSGHRITLPPASWAFRSAVRSAQRHQGGARRVGDSRGAEYAVGLIPRHAAGIRTVMVLGHINSKRPGAGGCPARARAQAFWALRGGWLDALLAGITLAKGILWRSDAIAHDVVSTKGAPEAVADLCNLPLDVRERVLAQATRLADRGLRVLGVAKALHPAARDWPQIQHDFAFAPSRHRERWY